MKTFLSFLPLIIDAIFFLFMGFLIVDSENKKALKRQQKVKQKQKKIVLA